MYSITLNESIIGSIEVFYMTENIVSISQKSEKSSSNLFLTFQGATSVVVFSFSCNYVRLSLVIWQNVRVKQLL